MFKKVCFLSVSQTLTLVTAQAKWRCSLRLFYGVTPLAFYGVRLSAFYEERFPFSVFRFPNSSLIKSFPF